ASELRNVRGLVHRLNQTDTGQVSGSVFMESTRFLSGLERKDPVDMLQLSAVDSIVGGLVQLVMFVFVPATLVSDVQQWRMASVQPLAAPAAPLALEAPKVRGRAVSRGSKAKPISRSRSRSRRRSRS